MIILKVFEIRSLLKDAREASKNPVEFGTKLLIKKTRLVLIISLILDLVFLGAFYILGYTGWFLSYWTLFKVLFWMLLVPSLFIVPFLFTVIKETSHIIKRFPESKEVEIQEVKITEAIKN